MIPGAQDGSVFAMKVQYVYVITSLLFISRQRYYLTLITTTSDACVNHNARFATPKEFFFFCKSEERKKDKRINSNNPDTYMPVAPVCSYTAERERGREGEMKQKKQKNHGTKKIQPSVRCDVLERLLFLPPPFLVVSSRSAFLGQSGQISMFSRGNHHSRNKKKR